MTKMVTVPQRCEPSFRGLFTMATIGCCMEEYLSNIHPNWYTVCLSHGENCCCTEEYLSNIHPNWYISGSIQSIPRYFCFWSVILPDLSENLLCTRVYWSIYSSSHSVKCFSSSDDQYGYFRFPRLFTM